MQHLDYKSSKKDESLPPRWHRQALRVSLSLNQLTLLSAVTAIVLQIFVAINLLNYEVLLLPAIILFGCCLTAFVSSTLSVAVHLAESTTSSARTSLAALLILVFSFADFVIVCSRLHPPLK